MMCAKTMEWKLTGSLVVLAVALAACGGTTFREASDSGVPLADAGKDASHPADAVGDASLPDATADAPAPGDASRPDATSGGCPTAVPAAGGACSDESLACEYGEDPQLSCDRVFTCKSGAWVITQAPPSPCATTLAASCPATLFDLPVGQACSPQAECDYPEARCNCNVQCFGGLCAAPVDGGPNMKTWACDIPTTPTSCPIPRARLGASCSTPAEMCDYGACSGNVAMQCTGGVWVETFVACPV